MDFKNVNFLLKLFAMILNYIVVLMWCISDTHQNAMGLKFISQFLYAITVPGYIIILTGMVILYILDEVPGQWFQRLFIVTGFILFLVVGIIALINCLDVNYGDLPLIMSILCIVIGGVLIVDFLKAESIL